MRGTRNKHFVVFHIVKGRFKGFTNTGYDTMYFDHAANIPSVGNDNATWVPALIKVDDKEVQSILKETPFNAEIEIVFEHGTMDGNSYSAKLVRLNPNS